MNEVFDQTLFAKMIKEARAAKGFTVEEVAEKIGKSVRTVNQIEAGDRSTRFPTFIAICNALEVTPDYFLGIFTKCKSDDKSSTYEQIFDRLDKMDEDELKFALELLDMTFKFSNRKKR